MTNTITGLDGAHELLIKLVDQTPDDWQMRKKVVKLLFDSKYYRDASKLIWNAPEIPPTGEEIVFSAKIVAKGQPTRAMRLINTVIEKNLGHPEENLEIAKLFVKAGMPLQAIRFYGAAVALDVNLVDEHFEIAVIDCDSEKRDWNEDVRSDEFPWEGPEEEVASLTNQEKADAHAELLNGLTQPVPMKAPARSDTSALKKRSMEKPLEAKPLTFKDESSDEKPKENSSVAATTEKKAETELTSSKEEVTKEEETTVQEVAAVLPLKSPFEQNEMKPETSAPEPAPVASSEKEDTSAKTAEVSATETEQNQPFTADAETVIDLGATATDEKVSEPAGEVKEQPLVDKPEAAATFFKSSDDAKNAVGLKSAELEDKAEDHQSGNSLAGKSEVTDIMQKAVASEDAKSVEEPSESGADKQENDLDDFVADTMAQYEESSSEKVKKTKSGGIFGALGSLMGRFKKSSDPVSKKAATLKEDKGSLMNDTAVEQVAASESDSPVKEAAKSTAVTSNPVSGPVTSSQVPVSPVKQTVESKAIHQPAPTTVAKEENTHQAKPDQAQQAASTGPKPLYKSGVHTSAQRLVSNNQVQEEPETPKELDGRTQLVALAPEDGRPFFEQLKAKYQSVNPNELPMVARIARDMANADYLDLIARVCVEDHKDLDAFSKLLGLHRVMINAGCRDWAEDMNLLRKGYGDAVLATVVSRYSVSECREILNSVYQTPAAAAM